MNFLEMAEKRYSVRRYSDKKVETEKLEKILHAAHVAPTAVNLQPVLTMSYEKGQFNCPVEATLFLIGGKYKPLILWYLIEKPLHYMELQRLIPKATPKMLSQQLHDLEECGMIHREVIPEKPPRTIYSLTALGQSKTGEDIARSPCSPNGSESPTSTFDCSTGKERS